MQPVISPEDFPDQPEALRNEDATGSAMESLSTKPCHADLPDPRLSSMQILPFQSLGGGDQTHAALDRNEATSVSHPRTPESSERQIPTEFRLQGEHPPLYPATAQCNLMEHAIATVPRVEGSKGSDFLRHLEPPSVHAMPIPNFGFGCGPHETHDGLPSFHVHPPGDPEGHISPPGSGEALQSSGTPEKPMKHPAQAAYVHSLHPSAGVQISPPTLFPAMPSPR